MQLAGLPRAEAAHPSGLQESLAHLATHPEDAACLHRIGQSFLEMKRFRSAAAYLEAAQALTPDRLDPLLGTAWLEAGDYARAEAVYVSILAHAPHHPDSLGGMGNSRMRQKDWRGALHYYSQLDALMPEQASLLRTMAKCHALLIELEAATRLLERVAALMPGDPQIRAELAWLRHEEGSNDEAERLFSEITASPPPPDITYSHGFWLLHNGRWAEGLPHYEARWNTSQLGARYRSVTDPIGSPRWDGISDLAGKTVMAVVEQGGGDLIQFARFCRELAAMGATVDLLSTETLSPVMKTMPWIRAVHTRYQDIPPHDFHVPLMSCPQFFGLTPQTIPHHPPYLTAPKNRERWSEKLTIGLVWQGDPTYPYDHYRSLRFEDYSGIIDRFPGHCFVSLQVGALGPAAAEAIGAGALIEGAAEIEDYGDTAAALNAIDLLISPDTSIAHLAGAMGRPTALLLSARPDWRWFGQEIDTPWYEKHALWRQERLGEWQPVLAALAEQLPRV